MIVLQIIISISTLVAFWMVSHRDPDIYFYGLGWSFVVEWLWVGMFVTTGQYGLLPVSVVMMVVVVYRLWEIMTG